MTLRNLEELYHHMLQDIYYAENKITKALSTMAAHTSDPKLKKGFEKHLEETNDQIQKLDQVFEICGYTPSGEKCEAIEGLVKEGEELMQEAAPGAVCDSALIAAAQKVEHYEIASYETLCKVAKKLGHETAADILHEILEQEKATDETLTKLCDDIEDDAMKLAA